MKLSLPSSIFSLAFLSVAAATAQCGYDPELLNDANTDYAGEPISIVSQDSTTVTFTVSQTWSDDLLCLIATHYTGDSGEVCPSVANAAPGEVAEYTAVCVNGYATVDIYAFDPTFLDNTSPPTIDSLCEQTDTSKTYLYQYSIPCSMGDPATCPPPTEPTCVELGEVSYDFENAGDVEAFLFGKAGSSGGNGFLQLDADNLEVSKTVDIPAGTTGVSFVFDFLTINALAPDQKVLARVGDYYLNITSALALTMGAAKTEYFGEIEARVEKLGFTSNVRATIKVPASFYDGGYLSVGARTTGSTSTFVAGVDNVKLVLECDETVTNPTTTDATTTAATTTATTPSFDDGTKAGGGGGDPHFQRWGREHSSFHGECDLVMVHSDTFHNNAGLDLHVRTTIEDYFSYIESAALRVGKSTLEFHQHHFYLDGTKYTPSDLPLTFGGDFKYTVSNAEIESGKNEKFYQYYKVDLHEDSSIIFKYYKKYLTIAIAGHTNDFSDSIGLLGDYATGDMLDRAGKVMTDFDEYGFEWQVNPEDAKLFMDARAPQLPFEQCRMPTAARPARRKLRGADSALYEAAKEACAHVSGSDYDLCTDDVMSTGDVGLASLW